MRGRGPGESPSRQVESTAIPRPECSFCSEFTGSETLFSRALRGQGLPDRNLIRANGVVSLVGLGPLTSGYTLILPEDHYLSMGALPSSLLAEVNRHKSRIVAAIVEEYGSVLCFEHGAVSPDLQGGGCVDHAHLHLIAGCQGFRARVEEDFAGTAVGGLDDLREIAVEGTPYLYLEDLDGSCLVYRVSQGVPSQYLRRVWARSLGRPEEWDWALFRNYDLMRETFQRLSSRLSAQTYAERQIDASGQRD
jgi:diadenosine tetraphosphate (Ap4A) HIT family hydrolase